MQKFRDVLSRWERKQLSAMEGGRDSGMLGAAVPALPVSLRGGGLQGLFDRRLKHFHEHLQKQHSFRWSSTWVKTQLHTAGLVERNKSFASVTVIDDDLGRSGSGLIDRPGFQKLVASVCARSIGAILCIEASPSPVTAVTGTI